MAATFGGNRLESSVHTCGVAALKNEERVEGEVELKGVETHEVPSVHNCFCFLDGLLKEHISHLKADLREDFDKALTSTKRASSQYRLSTISERKDGLFKLFAALNIAADTLKDSNITEEDFAVSLNILNHCVNTHSKYVMDEKLINVDNQTHTITGVTFGAVGIIGAILPREAQLSTIISILAPALLCGNVVVIKPSYSNSKIAYELAKILQKMAVLPGLVTILSGPGDVFGLSMIRCPWIEKVKRIISNFFIAFTYLFSVCSSGYLRRLHGN
jgi:acyl-CoA reductase-like NAD-dependent aldehyde dehydrogenase